MKISSYSINQRNLLSSNPGIYRFYDKFGVLIYVGKAKNIKKRVVSYFNKSTNHSLKTQKMVNQVDSIECTIVNSEYEALLLENNLIKNNNPKYNILLRDDKTYPYLCILDERFPRIISTRDLKRHKGKFFGPFTDVGSMNKILSLIKELFKIRTCNYNLSIANIEKKKFKVCLEYHIKNCKGPCENLQSEDNYNNDMSQIEHILKGNFFFVKKELKIRMNEASNKLEFEIAQKYKEKINALDKYYHKSLIINPLKSENLDVFSITSNDKKGFVSYLKVMNGIITFTQTIEIDKKLEESDEEILLTVIIYLRQKHKSNSVEIISNIDLNNESLNAKTIVPKIGDKRKILDLAIKNSLLAKKESISKNFNERENKTLNIIHEDLNLKSVPNYIECFDNSNTQGTNPVAAMVCFKDGKPSKKLYRLFNIKTVKGPNDYASMKEIVLRRYKKIVEDKEPLPNLIIIDGGKGQLSSAISALKEVGILEKVDIISIAKKLEEIYKPNDPYPIHLDKKSFSLRLIQRIRDEAHRFAIKFHKRKRDIKSIKTQLEGIKGIGPKTIQILLRTFGSISNIKNSTLEEISNIIGNKKASLIKQFLK